MPLIYLDNAASTKPYPAVNEDFAYINDNFYGNPSAIHGFGIEAEKLLEHSRHLLSTFLKVKQSEIIFTSGATESINLALRGIFLAHGKKKKTILTTSTEHSAVYETLLMLKKQNGAHISYLDLDELGIIDPRSLLKHLTDDVVLVSLTHINNETGIINPVAETAAFIKARCPNAYIHIDAVQSFCKIDISKELSNIDLISCSAHKVHGPKGTGFLYVKDGIRLEQILSGGEQEKNLRPGTINLPLIYSFCNIIPLIKEKYQNDLKHVSLLNEYFLNKLKGSGINAKVNFLRNCSPYIISICFPGIKSEILVHHLEKEDIIISAGAACSSRKKHNRVLSAFGLPDKTAESTVRISFSAQNTKEEIDFLFKVLNEIIKKIS